MVLLTRTNCLDVFYWPVFAVMAVTETGNCKYIFPLTEVPYAFRC